MSWVMVVWINLAFGEIRHVPQTQSHAPGRADRRDCHEFGRIRATVSVPAAARWPPALYPDDSHPPAALYPPRTWRRRQRHPLCPWGTVLGWASRQQLGAQDLRLLTR